MNDHTDSGDASREEDVLTDADHQRVTVLNAQRAWDRAHR